MRRVPWIVGMVWLCWATGGFGQGLALETNGPRIAVDGWVESLDGLVIEGARVEAHAVAGHHAMMRRLFERRPMSEPRASTFSDTDGRFVLTLPQAGLWRLRVEADGFLAMRHTELLLVSSRTLEPVRLHRQARTVITVREGTVSRPGVAVVARSADGFWADRVGGWQPEYRYGWTDETGRLDLPRAVGERLDVEAAEATTWAPRRVSGTRRARLDLGAAGAVLELRVVDSAGDPLPNVVAARRGSPWPIGLSDAQGRLRLLGPEGESAPLLLLGADGRLKAVDIPAGEERPEVVLPDLHPVVGRVMTKAGQPVPGAWVVPRLAPAQAVQTGPDGSFGLGLLGGRQDGVEVYATGFVPWRAGFEDVAFGETVIRLTRSRALVGRVTDAAGVGVAGVRLIARSELAPASWRFRPDGDWAVSRADGHFVFNSGFHPASGPLLVEGSPPGFQPFQALAGEAPLAIELHRFRAAFGHVVDDRDRPVEEAGVWVVGKRAEGPSGGVDPLEPFAARTDADGGFELFLPGPEFDLEARADGKAPARVRGLHIPPGVGPADLGTLRLDPGARLAGRVVNVQQEALGGAEIFVLSADEIRRLKAGQPPEREADAESEPTGRFRLGSLMPGQSCQLWVRATGYVSTSLRAVPESDAPELRAVLEPAAIVHGQVVDVDGRGIASAEVHAVHRGEGDGMHGTVRATTSDRGLFAFELSPGTFEIHAEASGFLPASHRLRGMAAGEQPALRLVLERGAVVKGQVVDVDGVGIAGALLRLANTSAESGPEGSFQIHGAPLGRQRLHVAHPAYGPLLQDVTVEWALPPIEIVLAGGKSIEGRVTDLENFPVAGIALELLTVDRQATGLSAVSERGGSFRFPRVADGEYRLRVADSRWTLATESPEIFVAEESVDGLEIRLQRGARVHGKILGLDFDALAQVAVQAESGSGAVRVGEVDYEGHYEAVGLAPGAWHVRATLDGGARQARARIWIPAGERRVDQDLEFGGGYRLSGEVFFLGEALPGTELTARGRQRGTSRAVRTDAEGRFHLEDLATDTYDLGLVHRRERLIHNQVLDLAEDRHLRIEIPAASLGGEVVDGASGAALADVLIQLRQQLPDGSTASVIGQPSGAEGRFHFERLPPGRFVLRVQHDGYQTFRREIDVTGGTDTTRIALEPSPGLEVAVRLASGRVPRFVSIHGLPVQGAGSTGPFQVTRAAGGEGRTHLATLPPGLWHLQISGTDGGLVETVVEVPGEPVEVVLPDAGRVRLAVPRLVGLGTRARARLVDSTGQLHRHLPPGGTVETQWPVIAGEATIEGVPAGAWTLQVEDPVGAVWTAPVQTTGGPEVTVLLD